MGKIFYYLNIYCFVLVVMGEGSKYIENFTENNDISRWIEHSDTIRNVGKSKASLVLQQTTTFQRGILFTLLNPQPCGAGFAGIIKYIPLNLSSFNTISIKVRGQGFFKGYKLIFKETGKKYSFCNIFEAPEDFKTITLPLDDFKPYYEGQLINDPKIQFDRSKIESIGIQAYGGAYLPIKQSGVASLEIDWIKSE